MAGATIYAVTPRNLALAIISSTFEWGHFQKEYGQSGYLFLAVIYPLVHLFAYKQFVGNFCTVIVTVFSLHRAEIIFVFSPHVMHPISGSDLWL